MALYAVSGGSEPDPCRSPGSVLSGDMSVIGLPFGHNGSVRVLPDRARHSASLAIGITSRPTFDPAAVRHAATRARYAAFEYVLARRGNVGSDHVLTTRWVAP